MGISFFVYMYMCIYIYTKIYMYTVYRIIKYNII